MTSDLKRLKLSVALTTFNHEAFIGKCLDSIIEQNLNVPYEIVIGEDKSSDLTLQIILTYKVKFPDIIRILERK